jgi:multicomponent Na+:H+ antiporter subunit E
MSGFNWNILLAILWATVTGRFTFGNVIFGFVIGYIVLYFARRAAHVSHYFRRVPDTISLFVFFIGEMIVANIRVARDVIRPQFQMQPGVIGIPLDARTDAEITLLANLITLTPGTLSLDVSTDRRILYVHAMYAQDVEEVRRHVKDRLERRLLRVTR